MKQIISGGGGGTRLPTEDEVEVAEILLTMPKLFAKSELIKRFSFTWGFKKKRSVLVSKSESSPSSLTVTEKVTAAAVVEADKSPSTPFCFMPSGSGSDGVDKCKTSSFGKRSLKKKAANDLMKSYNKMQQEREILLKETKAMKTLHQELTSANLELKAIIQKTQNYMFAPQTQQQQQQQQLVVDPNNGKLMAVTCSSNSHSGGRFGMFNQIDPRVKMMQGEGYDYMGCSQPLDQSKYLMMDNDLRVRTAAAAARKRRIMRMKENKSSLLALKLARGSR